MTMSHDAHERRADDALRNQPVRIGVVTISDTRTATDDRSGDHIARTLSDAGHEIIDRSLVRDEPREIVDRIRTLAEDARVQVIISTGGTGLAPRDTTIDVIRPLLIREIEGFGELFRMLSHREIGAAAMMSRAVAGELASGREDGRTVVFCLPGSTNAVRLALDQLIVPQLRHLVWQLHES